MFTYNGVYLCSDRKQAKMDSRTLREISVSEMRTSVCVCVHVREREGEKQAASLLFSGAGHQATRQQGGIITEAVTFLWFL